MDALREALANCGEDDHTRIDEEGRVQAFATRFLGHISLPMGRCSWTVHLPPSAPCPAAGEDAGHMCTAGGAAEVGSALAGDYTLRDDPLNQRPRACKEQPMLPCARACSGTLPSRSAISACCVWQSAALRKSWACW